jgi:hypothetical protein
LLNLQVISIDVRSNLLEGPGVINYEGCRAHERTGKNNNHQDEISYCKILNANMPDNIQVIAWAPCPREDFSARFDCNSRTYKYFFPRADLSLQRLNEAGQLLLGEHDFRNFCKMDVAHGVVNYHRYGVHYSYIYSNIFLGKLFITKNLPNFYFISNLKKKNIRNFFVNFLFNLFWLSVFRSQFGARWFRKQYIRA